MVCVFVCCFLRPDTPSVTHNNRQYLLCCSVFFLFVVKLTYCVCFIIIRKRSAKRSNISTELFQCYKQNIFAKSFKMRVSRQFLFTRAEALLHTVDRALLHYLIHLCFDQVSTLCWVVCGGDAGKGQNGAVF